MDLKFAALNGGGLDLIGRPERLPRLRELRLAGSLLLLAWSLRKILCGVDVGSGGMGWGVEILDLRWTIDLRVEWIEAWLERRQASSPGGRMITGTVDLRGCDMVTDNAVERLRRKWPAVGIKYTSVASEISCIYSA